MTRPIPWHLLTDTQRKIMNDRLNGHSWRTIATAMHLDEATVRGHHRRAMDRIRKAQETA